jgi:hypothetical protein
VRTKDKKDGASNTLHSEKRLLQRWTVISPAREEVLYLLQTHGEDY